MIDYSGANPVTYWYLYDAHGNVVGLSDKNGNKVASYEYDAWGNILSQSSTVNTGDGVALWKANPFRYSGYQYDDETGMYYLKSRYYSPFLGRFITRDAIFALNLYRYAANNPVNYIDPNGYYHAVPDDVSYTSGQSTNQNDSSNNSSTSSTVVAAAAISGGDKLAEGAVNKLTQSAVNIAKYTSKKMNLGGKIELIKPSQPSTAVQSTRGLAKIGIVSVGFTLWNGYKNIRNYGAKEGALRTGIDIAMLGLAVGATAFLAPTAAGFFGVTATAGLAYGAISAGVGALTGLGSGLLGSAIKRKIFG